jgi:hypothetical protein
LAPPISAPVSTARTPGTSFAAAVSMLTIFACANGLMAKAAHSVFGRLMSAVYLMRPLTLSRPSTRISFVSKIAPAGTAVFCVADI